MYEFLAILSHEFRKSIVDRGYSHEDRDWWLFINQILQEACPDLLHNDARNVFSSQSY